MNIETILAFSIVAAVAIVSPGPAVLLAIRNGAALGMRAVIWSSLGNICGIFLLSAAAMLGLGVLLMSSTLLFGAVKLLGALYLFYIGVRHLFGRTSALGRSADVHTDPTPFSPFRLSREAFFLAATNPKPILFFTALFPQFISAQAPLLPQFFALTGIFMGLSFVTLVGYALAASRAKAVLFKSTVVKWFNRAVGAAFISFGVVLLAMRRSGT
jgi:homoserine/homoserine lactone efflux protein